MKQIIYIVTAKNQSIEVWELLKSGKLNLKQIINTSFQEGQPLLILKKRKKLYVGVRPNYKILVYDILSDGILKKYSESIIPYSPNYLSCDDNEKFLFCGYYHAGCMSISSINKYHIPNKPIQLIYDIKGCHSIYVDHLNKLIFVSSLLSNSIYLFSLKELLYNNKIMHVLDHVKCKNNSGPRHIDIHINRKYLYSINELNGTIDVWKISHDFNNLNNIQNISLSKECNIYNKYWSSDIHITSCGTYLYAADRLLNIITAFKIHGNKLHFIDQFHTCNEPKSFCMDIHNKYLICVGQRSNTMMVYKINKLNGVLNKIDEYKVGKQPTWITMHKL